MSAPATGEPLTPLVVRPVVMRRVAFALMAFFVVFFVVLALLMPTHEDGASFGVRDQIAAGFIGPLIALGVSFLARPQLRVDVDGIHLKGFLSNWKLVPWDLVVGVRFPAKVRFAQVVLPGEETLAVVALQRFDGDRAVEAMRSLRAWFAASRPPVAEQRPGPVTRG